MINNPMVPGDPGMYDLKKLVCMVLRHDGLLTGLDPIVQEKVRVAADALEGELNGIRNDIADLEESLAEKVSGVTIGDTGVIMHGLVNIPAINDYNQYGIPKIQTWSGLVASSNNLFIQEANTGWINSRAHYYPITPFNMDYAIKRALSDGVGVAYTPAEQAAARARLGFPIEWELKADVTNPAGNSFACDMSGCTEMMVYVTGTNTGISNLSARYADLTTGVIMGTALSNGSRSTLGYYVSLNDIATFGHAKYVAALNSWALSANANAYGFGEPVSNIRQLNLTNAGSTTNVHILVYGR